MKASTAQAIQQKQNPTLSPASVPLAGVVGTVVDCAKLAVEIAWDEIFDKAKVPALKNELSFSNCDHILGGMPG